MKATILLILFMGCGGIISAQDHSKKITEIKEFQIELNKEFSTPDESPLTKEDFKHFNGLEFFPIDTSYSIKAKFIRTPKQKPFKMATSTDRAPVYVKYGEAHFILDSVDVVLELYQNRELHKTKEYKNYLFLPFTDLTNGEETYGGGRYIDLTIPKGDSLNIDFNKSYNPYCAYSDRYSCPLVPGQNRVPIKIKAGVKAFKDSSH